MNSLIQRLQTRIVLLVVSLVLAAFALTIAVGFACVGVFLLLNDYMSPTAAAFVTAGGAVLFALFVLFIPRAASKLMAPKPIRATGDQAMPADPAVALGALMGAEVLKLLQTKSRIVILVSLVAGFVIGVSPRLRALLADLLKP